MRIGHDFDRTMALREAHLAAAEALRLAQQAGPQVDAVLACERLGIPVEYGVELPEDIAGRTIRRVNDVRIQLAGGFSNPEMQRFTMAHEVGHICIPGHEKLFSQTGQHDCRTGFGGRELHERQADHFAAAFLMPEASCRPLLDAIPDDQAGLQAIHQLRSTCAVSLTAAAIRYAELTSHIALVVISAGGRVQYGLPSQAFVEEFGPTVTMPADAPIPRRVPTATMVANPSLGERGERLDRGIDWSDWFPSLAGEAFEEVQGLGRWGKLLTVLTANEG